MFPFIKDLLFRSILKKHSFWPKITFWCLIFFFDMRSWNEWCTRWPQQIKNVQESSLKSLSLINILTINQAFFHIPNKTEMLINKTFLESNIHHDGWFVLSKVKFYSLSINNTNKLYSTKLLIWKRDAFN